MRVFGLMRYATSRFESGHDSTHRPGDAVLMDVHALVYRATGNSYPHSTGRSGRYRSPNTLPIGKGSRQKAELGIGAITQ